MPNCFPQDKAGCRLNALIVVFNSLGLLEPKLFVERQRVSVARLHVQVDFVAVVFVGNVQSFFE